jgi:elongation factor G
VEETVAEVDDELGEVFLMGEEATNAQLTAAIRRATIARTFAPLFMAGGWSCHNQHSTDVAFR